MATWNLDPTHSRIGFSVRHLGFSKVRGAFTDLSGRVVTTDDALVAAEATLQAGSIDTGVADRDNHLRSGDFFDAASFPTLDFRATGIEARGGDRYTLTGDLSIRGTTRPVSLDVEVLGQATDPWGGRRVALEAKGHIDRRDFGLTWNAALEAGGVLVGHTVELEIEAQAVLEVTRAAAG